MDNLGDRFRSWLQVSKVEGSGRKIADSARKSSNGALALLGLAALGYGIYNSVYTVDGGHRAIKFNRFSGVGGEIYKEGLHFAIPVLERPIIYDVRSRPNQISSLTGSKDLQMINATVRVLHKPDEKKLQTIYRELGSNYADRVLPSIANEVLKSVIAQYTAAELLTKRREVSGLIRAKLIERARHFNITVDDVAITHLEFGKDYTAAVEAKQVAQQEAERAKFLVQKALQEKRGKIVKAQGEAESIRLVSEATEQNSGFLDLRRLEAARDIADTLANSQNRIYLSSDALLLNLSDVLASEKPGISTGKK